MGPSILQTLMREPTRSYQGIYSDPSTRPQSPSSRYQSHGFSRPSSVRSTTSDASLGSAAREPAWTNGQWEWSSFGGRKGLTGGARSLHTPSVVGRSLGLSSDRRGTASLRSASVYSDDGGDDGRSVRSGRSIGGDSVHSTMSAPGTGERRKVKKKKSRTAALDTLSESGSGYDVPARQRSLSSPHIVNEERRSSSRFETAPPLPKSFSSRFRRDGAEGEQTSRRYSSVSPSFPTSPDLSATSSSLSPRLDHRPSDDTTPSLTSSASSAPSSPPVTPIQAPGAGIPSLSLDGAGKPRKVKKRSSRLAHPMPMQPAAPHVTSEPEAIVSNLESQAEASNEVRCRLILAAPHLNIRLSDDRPIQLPPVIEAFEVPSSAQRAPASPVPEAGRFYSVDELFALASPEQDTVSASAASPAILDEPPTEASSNTIPLPSAPPPLSRLESDASFRTALDASPEVDASPPVPRLKLTRTESEQSRIGQRGSVELDLATDEDTVAEDSPVEPVRRARQLEQVQESREEEEQEAQSEREDEDAEEEDEADSAVEVQSPTGDAIDVPAVHVEPATPMAAAATESPVLARFVEAKRTRSKRLSAKDSSPTKSASSPSLRASSPEPSYQVIKTSKSTSRSSSVASFSSLDSHLRPSSPALSDLSGVSSSSAGSAPASTDVPDWLKRIRALGEPIQPLVAPPIPRPKRQLAPPPHWTVQQLRAQESSGASGHGGNTRPSMPRPRSVKSLRSRAKVLEAMPEDAEAEAEAVAADAQEILEPRSSSPAWVHKRDGVSPGPSGRTASPALGGSVSRSSSSASGGSGQPKSRRTRSMDLDRNHLYPDNTPLSRSTSLSSHRPASTATSKAPRYFEFDFEKIAAEAAKPKGLSKFFQPPLASSKAVREPAPIAVVNRPHQQSSPALRASSLRALSSDRRSFETRQQDEDDDMHSESGMSDLSIMSAPQLSPVRPPRNPARTAEPSPSPYLAAPPAFPPRSSSRERSKSPTPSIRSNLERPMPAFVPTSPQMERPPRPTSMSFSAVERPILSTPPPPAPPINLSISAAPTEAERAVSPEPARARPVSSYLAPSAVDLAATALAVSPRTDVRKQKTSKRFGLFKRTSSNQLSSSALASKQFEPSIDLVYDSIDRRMLSKRVRSDEVLVEVIAVGVDRWDRERVWQLARSPNGAGFVPGRALYGKVVETGDAVSKVKKGELVWGLSPLKKSGGLASFAILPRDHVASAPTALNAELLAALPAAATTAMLIMQSLCDTLPRGSKVLVLGAHQGVGHLCLQLARHYRPGVSGSRDLWMVAQCPIAVIDGETVCRDAGATDVLRDEPLAAINGLHEGSFDVVIDTLGGRRLYDASRRVLHNSGQFISTVGDDLSDTSDYNTSLRSLRRAFVRKDKKAIAYWRVDPDGDSREALRDTLDKVCSVVDAGALKPRVESVLSYGEARRTFEPREIDLDGVVVRVKEI
ncbi:hypothetical protein Rhopal_000834-T1 [Rhodotorula paludigena]|uniref:Enoyl reductase (ER) domain-containing protein n=1 Tax=Rhodotorula paludigena TaxID=86838 RepID=A0AAV5GBQ6_9BASI|nr:hypothetical protein Rhopal_000834-T1 [Rhodotorula paludigena]